MAADVGDSILRHEDPRFLTGKGCYLDDVPIARGCAGVFVRSPHAHAELVNIETSDALAVPGVLAVVTGTDLTAAGIGSMPSMQPLEGLDGSLQASPPHLPLTTDRVRYVGDPVALVVAESLNAAQQGAEAVWVDYDSLEPCASLRDALEPDRAPIWPEAGSNVCLDWATGDAAGTLAAFETAAHVVRLELGGNRVVPSPMEPRGCIGLYDEGRETYTLHVSSQGPHRVRETLARDVLKVPMDALRVITPDVGGGFGTKVFVYSEYAAVLWAARLVGRPVKWVSERAEAMMSDAHSREQASRAALALDAEGKFLGLRVDTDANIGAYVSAFSTYVPTSGTSALTGLYHIPVVYARVRCLFTNTVPLDAYRGAGKPEANFITERLVDEAARQLKISPLELRRRNLIGESALPYTSALGFTIDSGRFAESLSMASDAAKLAGLKRRQKEARACGKRRGMGISGYFENTAGAEEESARLRLNSEGRFQLHIGTLSNGQGHETTFAQIVAQKFGADPSDVRLVQGDTETISRGAGTIGSRSLVLGGAATASAAGRVLDKAQRLAGHLLEAAEADIELERGRFVVSGTDLSIGLAEVAEAAHDPAQLPNGMEPGLEEEGVGLPVPSTYPNGFHICEVEVDPDTGHVEVVRYTTVTDVGNVINPMIVKGQVHGGTAQGIGQALLEDCVYDSQGQLLSGSLMDYALPRADDLPDFSCLFNNVPCLTNPLGAKGCGEAGAVPAPAAVINAIVDALAEDGVRHVAMPATPMRVWQALEDAKGG
ncbi:MAG: xanthine dehydrogenase family protein molybdopterin-binding subunit [Alphaproteobacteria bacterium]|nr:xanthine dehydrogenase family protein molybdopterin-binding subunit [Alphaproteobacteria bacterium]